VAITATFAKGTNPDIAQVQVQNKVQQALTRLPASAGAGRARHQVEPRLPDDGAFRHL
jgi:multidrug efflux pump